MVFFNRMSADELEAYAQSGGSPGRFRATVGSSALLPITPVFREVHSYRVFHATGGAACIRLHPVKGEVAMDEWQIASRAWSACAQPWMAARCTMSTVVWFGGR